MVDVSTGEAWLTTDDRRQWHVEPRTLKGGVGSGLPREVTYLRSPPAPGRSVATAIGHLYFSESDKKTLTLSKGRSVRWTAPIGPGEIAAAWILDGRAILALKAWPTSTAVALDASDGHLIWRTGL